MKRALVVLILTTACARAPSKELSAMQTHSTPRWGMVIHGGAGAIDPANLAPERQKIYRAGLEEALRAGHRVLASSGSALDAVTAAVAVLEDNPLFNAGKGAVFNHEGKNELDASVMDGATQRAGAVAGVHRVKNPIRLARAVMEHSRHVMLIGDGAEQFAAQQGIELVDPSYFRTEERWQQLQRALEKERHGAPQGSLHPGANPGSTPAEWKLGTVGAVALDQNGRLAAATSTGGMTNKRFGRVGDSPIIGAGTYATSDCAVSGTGHGEFFIRYAVAHDICARVRYQKADLESAARAVVLDELVKVGGEGGVIAMDASGNMALVFNTPTMYRGSIHANGTMSVAIEK